MRGKILFLVLTISVVWVTGVYAQCKAVATTEFQGTVCTQTTGETKTGKWINEDGGVFTGKVILTKSTDKFVNISKIGTVLSADFSGTLEVSENKDPTGLISRYEVRKGKEKLDGGGAYDATSTMELRPDKSVNVSKIGKLISPTFSGNLETNEYKDPSNKISSYEVMNGTWRVTPSIKLTGAIIVERRPDGTVVVTDNRK